MYYTCNVLHISSYMLNSNEGVGNDVTRNTVTIPPSRSTPLPLPPPSCDIVCTYLSSYMISHMQILTPYTPEYLANYHTLHTWIFCKFSHPTHLHILLRAAQTLKHAQHCHFHHWVFAFAEFVWWRECVQTNRSKANPTVSQKKWARKVNGEFVCLFFKSLFQVSSISLFYKSLL